MLITGAVRWTIGVVVLLLIGSVGACTRETSTPEAADEKQAVVSGPAASAVPAAEGGAEAEGDDEFADDLVLVAEGEPDTGNAPLTVRFTVESLLDDDMSEPKYTWDFGDGSPLSNEASPTHTYARPGQYVATIRIIDSEGERGWDEVDIDITELAANVDR